MTPLMARLAMDAHEAFLAAAERVPEAFRDAGPQRLNSGAWLLVHAGSSAHLWISRYVGGRGGESPLTQGDEVPEFSIAIEAFRQVLDENMSVLRRLSDEDLLGPHRAPAASRWSAYPSGYLVARTTAHMYVHAADLNALAVLVGADDLGLPLRMEHTGALR